jgi:hypothetical protein
MIDLNTTPLQRVFRQPGEWKANDAPEAWLAERGFSVGRMQAHSPRGILFGEYDIQKWRNLDTREREELHGRMTGSARHGPIVLELFSWAPREAVAAFYQDALELRDVWEDDPPHMTPSRELGAPLPRAPLRVGETP